MFILCYNLIYFEKNTSMKYTKLLPRLPKLFWDIFFIKIQGFVTKKNEICFYSPTYLQGRCLLGSTAQCVIAFA